MKSITSLVKRPLPKQRPPPIWQSLPIRVIRTLTHVENMTTENAVGSENHFRFADLPFDIRIIIYQQCLVSASDLEIDSGALYDSVNKRVRLRAQERGLQPGLRSHLIFTCKWIFDEAAPILYGRNRFYFYLDDCFDTFFEFVNRINPNTISWIRNLSMRLPAIDSIFRRGQLKFCFNAVKKLHRLKSIYYYVSNDIWALDAEVIRLMNRSRGNAKVVLYVYPDLKPSKTSSERDIITEMEQWGFTVNFNE